jgi:hypothetical protein
MSSPNGLFVIGDLSVGFFWDYTGLERFVYMGQCVCTQNENGGNCSKSSIFLLWGR